jgi:hypothetical protein
VGMFRRVAKEYARSAEARDKWSDLEDALRLQMEGFSASHDLANPHYEKASSDEYLAKLVEASERRRDEATRLNLHGFSAAFSSIHCRTFLRVNQDVLLGKKEPNLIFTPYGVRQLSSLHSDVRYLAWGVEKAGVDKAEYWECKAMVDLYQFRVHELAKSKLEFGKLRIVNNYKSPPEENSVDWTQYEWTLLPPTNVITPSVPPM